MSSNPNRYKFVALVNKKLEPGIALNALGHAALGLGTTLVNSHLSDLQLLDYKDSDGTYHRNISALSLVVLKGTSGNIRALRNEAIACGLAHVDFTTTMTGGSYIDQLARTSQTDEKDLDYSVVVIFGENEELTKLTKKYSLYR
jgi:hypothetical protein